MARKRGQTSVPRLSEKEEKELSGPPSIDPNFTHNGSFSLYMQHKRAKLDAQFQSERAVAREHAHNDLNPMLFKGVSVHVNGLTKPGYDTLRQLVLARGGLFKNYLTSRSDVTHIVCDHLPDQKLLYFRRADGSHPPIVKAQWVLDCIRFNKLLPVDNYSLAQSLTLPGQRGIKSMLRAVSKPSSQRPLADAIDSQPQNDSGRKYSRFHPEAGTHDADTQGTQVVQRSQQLENAVEDNAYHRCDEYALRHTDASAGNAFEGRKDKSGTCLCVELDSSSTSAKAEQWLDTHYGLQSVRVGARQLFVNLVSDEAQSVAQSLCSFIKANSSGYILAGLGDTTRDALKACHQASDGEVVHTANEQQSTMIDWSATARSDLLPFPAEEISSMIASLLKAIKHAVNETKQFSCKQVGVECNGKRVEYQVSEPLSYDAVMRTATSATHSALGGHRRVTSLRIDVKLQRRKESTEAHRQPEIAIQNDISLKTQKEAGKHEHISAALREPLEAFNRLKDMDADEENRYPTGPADGKISDRHEQADTQNNNGQKKQNREHEVARVDANDIDPEVLKELPDNIRQEFESVYMGYQDLGFTDAAHDNKKASNDAQSSQCEQSSEDVFEPQEAQEVSQQLHRLLSDIIRSGDATRGSERICALRELLSCYVTECIQKHRFEGTLACSITPIVGQFCSYS